MKKRCHQITLVTPCISWFGVSRNLGTVPELGAGEGEKEMRECHRVFHDYCFGYKATAWRSGRGGCRRVAHNLSPRKRAYFLELTPARLSQTSCKGVCNLRYLARHLRPNACTPPWLAQALPGPRRSLATAEALLQPIRGTSVSTVSVHGRAKSSLQ